MSAQHRPDPNELVRRLDAAWEHLIASNAALDAVVKDWSSPEMSAVELAAQREAIDADTEVYDATFDLDTAILQGRFPQKRFGLA